MVDLGARRRLVGDDGVVDSVATWAWMLFSLWWRAFYFSLGTHFKFRRENCTIIRQVDVVGLDAWRKLVSDVDTVGSAEFWAWTPLSLFFVSLGDVLVHGDS